MNAKTAHGDGLTAAQVADELQRARDSIARSASDASGELAKELHKLQDDLAAIQRSVTGFGREVGTTAAGVAHDFADNAKQQASSAMADFEEFTRKNPHVVLGAALGLGVILGLLLRRS